MKNFLLIFLTLFSLASFAQTKISLKFAPVASSNRVTNDSLTAESQGAVLRLSVGMIADVPVTDTYYFSTGLVYIPKRMAFSDGAITEEYKAQYLQIPLTMKLYTGEVVPDVKIYFQVGSGLELKVFDEKEDPSYDFIEKFNAFDLPVILGAGAEYRVGINTVLYGGISYQRGLANAISMTRDNLADDLAIRNTIVSFDFGVKF